MFRQARLDAPGALHHIMVRGINKSAIFTDDQDKIRFLDRLKEEWSQSLKEDKSNIWLTNQSKGFFDSPFDELKGCSGPLVSSLCRGT
jgi:hypothetical protein